MVAPARPPREAPAARRARLQGLVEDAEREVFVAQQAVDRRNRDIETLNRRLLAEQGRLAAARPADRPGIEAMVTDLQDQVDGVTRALADEQIALRRAQAAQTAAQADLDRLPAAVRRPVVPPARRGFVLPEGWGRWVRMALLALLLFCLFLGALWTLIVLGPNFKADATKAWNSRGTPVPVVVDPAKSAGAPVANPTPLKEGQWQVPTLRGNGSVCEPCSGVNGLDKVYSQRTGQCEYPVPTVSCGYKAPGSVVPPAGSAITGTPTMTTPLFINGTEVERAIATGQDPCVAMSKSVGGQPEKWYNTQDASGNIIPNSCHYLGQDKLDPPAVNFTLASDQVAHIWLWYEGGKKMAITAVGPGSVNLPNYGIAEATLYLLPVGCAKYPCKGIDNKDYWGPLSAKDHQGLWTFGVLSGSEAGVCKWTKMGTPIDLAGCQVDVEGHQIKSAVAPAVVATVAPASVATVSCTTLPQLKIALASKGAIVKEAANYVTVNLTGDFTVPSGVVAQWAANPENKTPSDGKLVMPKGTTVTLFVTCP